jgi:hypothetical protein
VDLTLWHIDGVQDRHALTARAAADVPLADRDGGYSEQYQVGGGYRFRLDTEQGELHLGAVTRLFRGPLGTDATSEVAAAVQRRFDVPLTELRPLFGVRLARDVQRLDVTYVEPHATLDFGLPPKDDGAYSIGGRFALTSLWSDHPARSDGSGDFGHHATSLGLWGSYDRASTPVGPLLAELGVEHWWSRVTDDRSRFVVALRVVVRR